MDKMRQQAINRTGLINEILTGIVDRVTFHNPDKILQGRLFSYADALHTKNS